MSFVFVLTARASLSSPKVRVHVLAVIVSGVGVLCSVISVDYNPIDNLICIFSVGVDKIIELYLKRQNHRKVPFSSSGNGSQGGGNFV
jgi:hypothetical protein